MKIFKILLLTALPYTYSLNKIVDVGQHLSLKFDDVVFENPVSGNDLTLVLNGNIRWENQIPVNPEHNLYAYINAYVSKKEDNSYYLLESEVIHLYYLGYHYNIIINLLESGGLNHPINRGRFSIENTFDIPSFLSGYTITGQIDIYEESKDCSYRQLVGQGKTEKEFVIN